MKVLLVVLVLAIPLAASSQVSDSAFIAINAVVKPISPPHENNFVKNAVTFVPPALFVGYGFMSLNNKVVKRIDQSVYADMQEDHPGFSFHADDYLQMAPNVAVGLLSISGVKGQNHFLDQAALFAISTGIMSTSVTFFKRSTGKFRPNQSSYSSFPSGHTSTAFAAAEFLNQEYGGRSVWFGIAGYTAATATGVLRVYNNAHWFSDIVAGAGFGILSTKAAYLIYPQLKKLINTPKSHFTILPSYQKGYSGIALRGSF